MLGSESDAATEARTAAGGKYAPRPLLRYPPATDDVAAPPPATSGPENLLWPWIKTDRPVERLTDDICPTIALMELLGGKWSVPILHRLDLSGPIRPGALERGVPGISRKELTRRLRAFEALGWVTRRVYAEVPPRVEYALTDVGRLIVGPVKALSQWAEANAATLRGTRGEAQEFPSA